jgi:coproporphyrinogen III oxidase-like Fe-S oxidoreductase
VPEPEAVLEHARELRQRQRALSSQHLSLYDQAIEEELALRPKWLEQTLGHEPDDSLLRARWQQAARELARHRVRHYITQPNIAIAEQVDDLALQRAIGDTRAALGIDRQEQAHDAGYGR